MNHSLLNLLLSIVYLDYGKCFPKDSDSCLKRAKEWGSSYDCGRVRDYQKWCTKYEKDTRRCCPESCLQSHYLIAPFTKFKCEFSNWYGECDYTPVLYNEGAQCEVIGMISGNLLVSVKNSITDLFLEF